MNISGEAVPETDPEKVKDLFKIRKGGEVKPEEKSFFAWYLNPITPLGMGAFPFFHIPMYLLSPPSTFTNFMLGL
jgi:hypothetical protein